MASTGAAKARLPEPVTLKVKNGKIHVNDTYFTARAKQRLVFENGDDREYRLRLRRGYRGKPVDLCVILPANGAANLVVDPIVGPGSSAGVELIPGNEICAAGPIKGGPVNPPKSELGIAFSSVCSQGDEE
jgi:hypothetical protein